jgi:hypothetical protein
MPARMIKYLTVTFLFCLSAVFTPDIFGQDKQSKHALFINSSQELSKPQPEILTAPAEKKNLFGSPIKLPDNFRKNEHFSKLFSEIEKDDEIKIETNDDLNFHIQSKISGFAYKFHERKKPEKRILFDDLRAGDSNFSSPSPDQSGRLIKIKFADDDEKDSFESEKFDWNSAIKQSLIFLGVQHGYAMTQAKTRKSLKGNFFKDYAESVKSLQGWDDGGKFFTNYIAHPMQGAFTGFIYVQNDPKARKQEFGAKGDYWRSRMKAMAWTTVWSTQFEIGPLSQASIGNVGLTGKQTWEDIVVTPTLGTAMLIIEDAADRFITKAIERQTDNFYIKIFSRMLLSPTRVFANMLRFKAPWYRDRPPAFGD